MRNPLLGAALGMTEPAVRALTAGKMQPQAGGLSHNTTIFERPPVKSNPLIRKGSGLRAR